MTNDVLAQRDAVQSPVLQKGRELKLAATPKAFKNADFRCKGSLLAFLGLSVQYSVSINTYSDRITVDLNQGIQLTLTLDKPIGCTANTLGEKPCSPATYLVAEVFRTDSRKTKLYSGQRRSNPYTSNDLNRRLLNVKIQRKR